MYGHPSRRLALTGVTGTSGKTTTSYLIEAGLRAAGHRTGLIGGVQTRIGRRRPCPASSTTPEATDLQALPGGDGRARGHRGRHGGVQPRAGPGPGGRHLVRGGGVHQPVPGPPGLPRGHGGLLRGQGAAVHPRLRPVRGGQHRRRARPQARRCAQDPHHDVLRGRAPRRGLARGRTCGPARTAARSASSGPAACRPTSPLALPGRVQRGQRAGRDRRAGRVGHRAGGRGGRGRFLHRGARPAGAGRPGPGLRPCWSTTRTSRARWRRC